MCPADGSGDAGGGTWHAALKQRTRPATMEPRSPAGTLHRSPEARRTWPPDPPCVVWKNEQGPRRNRARMIRVVSKRCSRAESTQGMVVRAAAASSRKEPPKVLETRRPRLARGAVSAYRMQGDGDSVAATAPTPGPQVHAHGHRAASPVAPAPAAGRLPDGPEQSGSAGEPEGRPAHSSSWGRTRLRRPSRRRIRRPGNRPPPPPSPNGGASPGSERPQLSSGSARA